MPPLDPIWRSSMPGGSWAEPRLLLAGGLLGLGARVGDVRREQLEAAVLAAVREAPDAVVAERSPLVGDFPVVMRIAGGRDRRARQRGAGCCGRGRSAGVTSARPAAPARRARTGCSARAGAAGAGGGRTCRGGSSASMSSSSSPPRRRRRRSSQTASRSSSTAAATPPISAHGVELPESATTPPGGCWGAAEVNTCLTFSSEIFSVGEAAIVFRPPAGVGRRATPSSGTRRPPAPSSAGRDSRSPSAAGTCPS